MAIHRLSHSQSVVLLILTVFVWGSTFALIKGTVDSLSPSVIIGCRFLIAIAVIAPFCRRFSRRALRDGTILGGLAFLAYITQVIGLESISANRAAFITSLNVILVPLLGVLMGRLLSLRIGVAAGLAITGIGVMSWEGGAVGIGDIWMFGCALSYAVYVLFFEFAAPKHDPLVLTYLQLLIMAILGGLWAAPQLIEQLPMIAQNWQAIAYLGLIATAITTWVQTIAQRQLSANEAAIIYTLEPVFATVFSFYWLGEGLGIRGILGAVMVLSATLLIQRKPSGVN
jgi:drug/metabolite transporter (DMT)-like permease